MRSENRTKCVVHAIVLCCALVALAVNTEAFGEPAPAETPNALKNAVVLIIRHAEKPEEGETLSPAGVAHAQAYASYFQHYSIDGQPHVPDRLFAAKNSSESDRSGLTIEPTSKALGLPIDSRFTDNDYAELANLLRSTAQGSNILICWHHGNIPRLLEALGADTTKLLPKGKWPESVFDWVMQLRYDENGQLSDSTRIIENFAPDAADQPKPQPEPVMVLAAKTQPEPSTAPAAKPEPEPQTTPVAKPQPESGTTPVAKSQAEPQTTPAAKPLPEPQTTPAAKPLPESQPTLAAKPLPEPQTTLAAKPQAEPQPTPAAKPQADPQPSPAAKSQPEPQTTPAAKPAPEPQPTPATKPQPELSTAVAVKPQPEPGTTPAAKSESDPKSVAKPPVHTVQGGVDPHGDSWVSIQNSLQQFGQWQFILRLFLSLILAVTCAAVIGWNPRRSALANPVADLEERNALIILGVLGAIIAELSGASQVLAFVIFGIGALTRFRTALDNPKLTGKAILVVVIGLACGVGAWAMAVFVTTFTWFLVNWLESSVGCRLKIRLHPDVDPESVYGAVQSLLISHRCRLQGSALNKQQMTFLMLIPSALDPRELGRDLQRNLPKPGHAQIDIQAA